MTKQVGIFDTLAPQQTNALPALIAMHRGDPWPDTIDVGVGVYRDEVGRTPVMRAVKAAEARLLDEQSSKSYLGALPINADAVVAMRVSHGIHMPTDARITIAGRNRNNIARFIEGLLPHLHPIADAVSEAPVVVTAWMKRDDPTKPGREETCS